MPPTTVKPHYNKVAGDRELSSLEVICTVCSSKLTGASIGKVKSHVVSKHEFLRL